MQPKLLIANRGEIAIRIIRACKELGIRTVAVYSLADKDSLHVNMADESICIGGNSSHESYLNMNNVISAAISTGCTMIHPGYGFLSENAQFAEIVEKCNLTFVGPSSQIIRTIGDKATARSIAKQNLVPTAKGSESIIESIEEGLKLAQRIGFPVILKATSGGGGRGISIVRTAEEFKATFEKTALEAESSFGDKNLYMEQYIQSPRHIEIQLIGDKFGNVVHLGERDCSLQRRNQKLVEESPSPVINERIRRKIGAAAIKMAKAVKYNSVGTAEFVVDKIGKFYFIEMNARIQVEHPVTEEVTGIDLVKEQIRVAMGKPLSFRQLDVKMQGHAIECRINAEDPAQNFRPSPGAIKQIVFPGGIGVRIDTHIYPNYVIPPFYDSLLAKLVVHAPTRKEAIRKMRMALEQFIIDGITTNIEFQYLLMHTPEYIKGEFDTDFISVFQARYVGGLNGE